VATETLAFAPLRRIEGLPAGLPDAEAVMAREAALTWRPVPAAPATGWRIERNGDTLVLAG
jgi:hypothetical protein